MKNTAFIFLLSLLSVVVHAQNYSCIQPNRKCYFTNQSGYLRGIRIDSQQTHPEYTVYHPYRSPRGRYDEEAVIVGGMRILDSSGGSWVGKTIIQQNDGTFLFENHWHDTVIIKTQASIGDSWIFYSDTTSRYYKAYLTGNTTRLVSGITDSVKFISIKAFDDTGYVPGDVINNFQLILSKNHGFIQLFDLYTFPYHEPGKPYSEGMDYFLDKLNDNPTTLYPADNSAIFYACDFRMPLASEIYDWQPGDVYQCEECLGDGFCEQPYVYYTDSIKERIVVPEGIKYVYSGWKAERILPSPYTYIPYSIYPYKVKSRSGSYIVTNTIINDTTYMPEEYKQNIKTYYYQNDAIVQCTTSNMYTFFNHEIEGIRYRPFHEQTPFYITHKSGIAITAHYQAVGGSVPFINAAKLTYYNKNGRVCGKLKSPPVSVIDADKYSNTYPILLFPNPANNELNVSAVENGKYHISLYNVSGQLINDLLLTEMHTSINTKELNNGIYLLKVTDNFGYLQTHKVIIQH